MATHILLIDDNGMPVATIQPDMNDDQGEALAVEVINAVCIARNLELVPAAIMHHLAVTGTAERALPAAMAAIHYMAVALEGFAAEIRQTPGLTPADQIDGA